MLRRAERCRAIDRMSGKRLIVLNDDRVGSGRRISPQVGRHRLNAAGCACGRSSVLRRDGAKDEAGAKDKGRCKREPAHLSDCHVAVSSIHD